MEKVVYNPIMDKNYIGIVTVLNYETSVRKCLSSVLVGTQNRMERKVIVDLALKVGKELMSRDELSVMDGSKCILQLRFLLFWHSPRFQTQEPLTLFAQTFLDLLCERHRIVFVR